MAMPPPWPTRTASRAAAPDVGERNTPARGHLPDMGRPRERPARGRIPGPPGAIATEQLAPSSTLNPSALGRLDFYTDPHLSLDEDSSSSNDERGCTAVPKRPTGPSGHTRSLSHPFASILSLRKKPSASSNLGRTSMHDGGGAGPANMSNSSGDSARIRSKMRPPPSPQPPTVRGRGGGPGGPGVGGNDFATGNCMTCASPLRWPKGVTLFKCTKCMTVIDLHPFNPSHSLKPHHLQNRDRGRDGGPRLGPPPSHDVPGPQRVHPKVSSISLAHTKSLVHQCLKSFLSSSLQPPSTRASLDSASLHDTNPFKKPLEEERRKAALHKPEIIGWDKNEVTPPAVIPGYFDAAVQPTLHLDRSRSPRTPTPNPFGERLSASYPENRRSLYSPISNRPAENNAPTNQREVETKRIFRPLEDYIVACFETFECLNSSFPTARPSTSVSRPSMDQTRPVLPGGSRPPARRESSTEAPQPERKQSFAIETPYDRKGSVTAEPVLTEFDAKLLLVGGVAENGLWWTGNQAQLTPSRPQIQRNDSATHHLVNGRSPCIDWAELDCWYSTVINVGESWESVYDELIWSGQVEQVTPRELQLLESQILAAQEHTQRLLLKATEVILKRPGRVVTEPYELRFLLILVNNPLLYGPNVGFKGNYQALASPGLTGRDQKPHSAAQGPVSGHHSGIIKRILGLISNLSNECYNHLVSWFSRLSEQRFRRLKDLVGGFVTYRLSHQHPKWEEEEVDVMAGLIPDMPVGRTGNSAAFLHAALGFSATQSKKRQESPKKAVYDDDWQIRAAARVMSLIFTANKTPHSRRPDSSPTRGRIHLHGQILPTSDFYNSLLDYSDLIADYDAWESKRGRFSFCQFPFFLSLFAKIKIMEHDAKRQMKFRAREAFFDSIMTHKAAGQWLVLKVRRDCLVEDSLKSVSEVVGSGTEDIKKGLKIDFVGEEGVDAGGLRKEWFQILIREVFHPDHGMFIYDEDSQYCYFNPNSFETSDQFFLVGVVLGLAIYNCTILDVAFPPFAFRKLLASAPASALPVANYPRQTIPYTLEDLAEYRPQLAKGLEQLLEFDGDVETTFCLDFMIETDKYGARLEVPLCPGGRAIPVTNANRQEYVHLVVCYHLDVAVTRQFEPFKRGFFTVCAGNALSLFDPEEIELLIRGSDEALDINSLRGVAEYENWRREPAEQEGLSHNSVNMSPDTSNSTTQEAARARSRRSSESTWSDQSEQREGERAEDSEPTINWFWESFGSASSADQRKLLSFITGCDRIPATGETSLVIKISCLGDDCGRYPIARTCFNTLQLHRYGSKERLETVLWGAVNGSEGFGLK